MKKLIVYNILSLILITQAFSQSRVSGNIFDEISDDPIGNVAIYDVTNDQIFYSDNNGFFDFEINENTYELGFYLEGYTYLTKFLDNNYTNLTIKLSSKVQVLNEVVVRANRKKNLSNQKNERF
jgi:hypothetical protein